MVLIMNMGIVKGNIVQRGLKFFIIDEMKFEFEIL